MLMAHPAVLTVLVTRYEDLRHEVMLLGEEAAPTDRRRMEDLAYTLCVSTGTCDVDAALLAARLRLPGARPADDSVATV